jgi:Domain of unknown function (DUF4224)
MFLSPQEIERLTGKKRSSTQIRWLRDHGYRIDVNGLGEPLVAIAEANRKLVGGRTMALQQEPHWDGFRAAAMEKLRRRLRVPLPTVSMLEMNQSEWRERTFTCHVLPLTGRSSGGDLLDRSCTAVFLSRPTSRSRGARRNCATPQGSSRA